MIRSAKVIVCDNEHGAGDRMFPEIPTVQHFVQPTTVGKLRKQAKEAGWSHFKGLDFCDYCTENENRE